MGRVRRAAGARERAPGRGGSRPTLPAAAGPAPATASSTSHPAAAVPAVECVELGRPEDSYPALHRVQLRLWEGTVTAFTGAPGSGVETLLEVLATRLAPRTGSARICGHDTTSRTAAARSALGVVAREPADWGRVRVREALELTARAQAATASQARRHAEGLLEAADLRFHADAPCSQLSPRLRRRLALAAALVHGPRVVLLAEPLTGLGAQERAEVTSDLRRLAARGMTVVLGARQDEWLDDIADRIVVLEAGRLAASHDVRDVPLPVRWRVLSSDPDALRTGLDRLGVEHFDVEAGSAAGEQRPGEGDATGEAGEAEVDEGRVRQVEVLLAQERDAADLLTALVQAGVPVHGFVPPPTAPGVGAPGVGAPVVGAPGAGAPGRAEPGLASPGRAAPGRHESHEQGRQQP